MHFSKLLTAAACYLVLAHAIPAPDTNFVPTDYYKTKIAPSIARHIEDFRNDNAGTLKPAQLDFLNKAIETALSGDNSHLASLSDEAEALFGREQAATLFSGESLRARNLTARSNNLERRQVACECADNSDYCTGGFRCKYKRHNCAFVDDACGFMGWYVCNGLCVVDV